MRYIPHTPEDERAMLEAIGAESVDALFQPIPAELRLRQELDLPAALPEADLKDAVERLAGRNQDATRALSFVGAGLYNHYIPAAVREVTSRGEFYTAYTPYQPEVSQGTLQAIFEYQTMIARLLGMEVSNASMYDGSTAAAEAVLMARRIHKGKRPLVVVAGALHPEWLQVIRTYLTQPEQTLRYVRWGDDGRVDRAALAAALGPDVAAVLVQSPNFFGCVEDLEAVRAATLPHGILLAACFSEALSFGLLKPPGHDAADIVAGEGQSFGMPLSFGGPLLGIMATKKEYVRAIPGRLVGKTADRNGRDAYVITLATREQHIRREKATSNICTNEGLCALTAAVYLSLLGNDGMRKLALLNHRTSLLLARRLLTVPGVSLPFARTPWFNEFVVELPVPAQTLCDRLADDGIVPGVLLSRFFADQPNRLLVTATEANRPADLERLTQAMRGALK